MDQRLQLIKGETVYNSIKILLASRRQRRELELQKYLNSDSTPKNAPPGWSNDRLSDKVVEQIRAKQFLEERWYSGAHDLDTEAQSFRHFWDVGRNLAYSPNSHLVGEDGVTLSRWGTELLLRRGISIGSTGIDGLKPSDDRAIDPFKISNGKNKKIAVVTALFGEYDRLLPVDPSWAEEADFFVFSDQFFDQSKVWQHVHAPNHDVDPRRKAGFIKLNLPVFFQEYEWVLWVDGNVAVCRHPQTIVDRAVAKPFEFAVFSHSERNSIIAEAAACLELGKDDLDKVAWHFSKAGDPTKLRSDKLYETMVMLLKPSSSAVEELFTTWWGFLQNGSHRDQLSLPLALEKTPNLHFATLPGPITASAEFFIAKHRTLGL